MSDKIKTILIDDEKSSLIILEKLIARCCSNIEIIGKAQSVASGIEIINEQSPDLVFLDINMPDGDGFEILEKVDKRDFEVIFTTAYDKYAIKAFEFAALHYLLKPINSEDLKDAIDRFHEVKKEDYSDKLNVFNENKNLDRMILPSANGLSIIDINDIIRCESSNNYTTFYLKNNEKIIVSKSINLYEKILSDSHFCRIHNQHIVNLKYIKKYVKGRGGYVVMLNDTHVDVSEGRKKDFMTKLSKYAMG